MKAWHWVLLAGVGVAAVLAVAILSALGLIPFGAVRIATGACAAAAVLVHAARRSELPAATRSLRDRTVVAGLAVWAGAALHAGAPSQLIAALWVWAMVWGGATLLLAAAAALATRNWAAAEPLAQALLRGYARRWWAGLALLLAAAAIPYHVPALAVQFVGLLLSLHRLPWQPTQTANGMSAPAREETADAAPARRSPSGTGNGSTC